MRFCLCMMTTFMAASCGSSSFVEKTCEAQSPCFVFAGKGQAEVSFKGLQSNRDYYIWILSDKAVTQKNQSKQSIRINSNLASSRLSEEEEKIRSQLQQQNGTYPGASPNLQNIIGAPQPQFFSGHSLSALQSISSLELYIPEPRDYWTRLIPIQGQTMPAYVPIPTDVSQSGRRVAVERLSEGADYELLVDTTLFGAAASFKLDHQHYLDTFTSCLNQLLPKVIAILGRPLFQLNAHKKLNLLLTQFKSGTHSKNAGLFSQRDRFSRNGNKPLTDSNRGEYIYIDPTESPSFSCNTVLHEYSHLRGFDEKTLAPLDPSRRDDLSVMNQLNTPVQRLSLSEGAAHLMEVLSGEAAQVPQFIRNFLLRPSEATLALELVFDDFVQNTRTRGLATLLYLHALQRAGGTLSLDDPNTQKVISAWTKSRRLSVDVFADYFHESPQDFLRQFFERLTKSLLLGSSNAQFLPSREGLSTNDHGFEILALASNAFARPAGSTTIHPLEIDIPALKTYQNHFAFPQALLGFRFRSSMKTDDVLKLTVESDENPLYIGIVLGETSS